MKKKLYDKIIFIIVAFILLNYFKECITIDALGDVGYTSSSQTSNVFVLLIITFFYDILNFKFLIGNKLVKTLSFFFLSFYVLSIINSLFFSFESRVLYGLLLLPLTMFWYFFILAKKYNFTNIIVFTMSVLTLGLIYLYYQYFLFRQFYFQSETLTSPSYYIMYMLPFLLCNKSKIVKIILIIITSLVVFTSFKRTGTIAIILVILTYVYIEYIIDKKLLGKILIITILGLAIYYLISLNLFENSYLISRFKNIKEDQGSNRIEVWNVTWRMIKQSNFFQLLFGHGFNMVSKDSPLKLSAHNDFLEVLYDFGFPVLVFLLYLLVKLIKLTLELIKHKSKYAVPMTASVILFIINLMSSHIIIYIYYLIIFSMFWGFILGDLENKNYKNNNY